VNPKFVIAYPFGGRPVPVDWHLAVRSLKIPTNCRVTEICTRARIGEDGRWKWSLEEAQTHLVEQAIEMGTKYILFIEDDTAPPPETIMELGRVLDGSDESVMACGGIYTTRSNPPEPLVYIRPGEGCFWDWKIGDVFECCYMGFGCQMLKMEIFKLMPKPWFRELKTWDDIRQYPELFPETLPGESSNHCDERTGMSTDFFFFAKLARMGFKVLAHGGVLPVHWDVEKQIPYWLPKGSPPTRGIRIDGKEYGWTDPAMEILA
jgi:hypothetical protein